VLEMQHTLPYLRQRPVRCGRSKDSQRGFGSSPHFQAPTRSNRVNL
jgi:hypothetical protein